MFEAEPDALADSPRSRLSHHVVDMDMQCAGTNGCSTICGFL